jgi:hypothetical protein
MMVLESLIKLVGWHKINFIHNYDMTDVKLLSYAVIQNFETQQPELPCGITFNSLFVHLKLNLKNDLKF